MSVNPAYIIVADSNSLRWEHYERDLKQFWEARGCTPKINLVEWSQLLANWKDPSNLLTNEDGVLRIESPARDLSLITTLAEIGKAGTDDGKVESNVRQTWWGKFKKKPNQSELLDPRFICHGLEKVLKQLDASLQSRPGIKKSQNINDLIDLFDKNYISKRLQDAEIATPDAFRPESSQHLLDEVDARRWGEFYLKSAFGSCAANMMHLYRASGGLWGESTLLEIKKGRRKGQFVKPEQPQLLRGRDLDNLLEYLIANQATAQRAVVKASYQGNNFDVRVIVIDNKIAASVFRVSKHAMTNLHFGGTRGNPELLHRVIPRRAWLDAMAECLEAAELFDIPALGIDLAFEMDSFEPAIIEINSFGDFFPNWQDAQGRTVHSLEIEASARKMGWI